MRATKLRQKWLIFPTTLARDQSKPVLQLTLALSELAEKRYVQDRLRAEIMETLGRIRARGDSDFTVNDFDSMPYLLAVGKVCLGQTSVGES